MKWKNRLVEYHWVAMGDSKGGTDGGRIPGQYEGYTIQRVDEIDSQWSPQSAILARIRNLKIVAAKPGMPIYQTIFPQLPKDYNNYQIQAEGNHEMLEALQELSTRYEHIALYCEDLVCHIKLDDERGEKKNSLIPGDNSSLKLIYVPTSEIEEAVSYSREHSGEFWGDVMKFDFCNLDIVCYAYQFPSEPRILDNQEHRLFGRVYATWFCWDRRFAYSDEEKEIVSNNRERRRSGFNSEWYDEYMKRS